MKINKTQFVSPNFSDRKHDVDIIVIHSTHMSKMDSLNRLCSKESEVSCHYLLDFEGNIYQLVPEAKVAFHAGISYWRGREAINKFSIGIELVDTDDQNRRVSSFTEIQMRSLTSLIKFITSNHNIKPYNIVAHSDIAPDRKDDPGEEFSWSALGHAGIGIYPKNHAHSNGNFVIKLHDNGEDVKLVQKLLNKYGYKISVDGIYGTETEDVIKAFKRHFDQRKIDGVFDSISLSILQEIVKISDGIN